MNESTRWPKFSGLSLRDDVLVLVRGLGFLLSLGVSCPLPSVVLPSSACLNFSSAVFSAILFCPSFDTALVPIINHHGHKKSLRIILRKLFVVCSSLNEVRTRVLALRGLRPGPLVDEAGFLQQSEYYHDKSFFASRIVN